MKRILPVFCLILLFSLLAGCAREAKEKELEILTIAFQQWVGYGPLYLAQDKGFFEKEGMELILIDETLDSARRDAFDLGMLDCEAGTIDLLVSKRAQGTPVVSVLGIDLSCGSDGIVVAEGIEKLEDLVGKKVTLARNDVGETFISYLLYEKDLTLDDIIVVPERPEEVWQIFLNGEADAAVTWEPWLSKVLERPGAHLLISTKEKPNIIIDTLNVREDIVENNPQLVKKLMRVWFKAIDYYIKNPVEASGIIAKYYGITAEEYRKQVEGLQWIAYERQIDEKEIELPMKAFEIISEIKFKAGRIPCKPDAGKAINTALLRTLYENSQ